MVEFWGLNGQKRRLEIAQVCAEVLAGARVYACGRKGLLLAGARSLPCGRKRCTALWAQAKLLAAARSPVSASSLLFSIVLIIGVFVQVSLTTEKTRKVIVNSF